MSSLAYGHRKNGQWTIKTPEITRLVERITKADDDTQLLSYARQIKQLGGRVDDRKDEYSHAMLLVSEYGKERNRLGRLEETKGVTIEELNAQDKRVFEAYGKVAVAVRTLLRSHV